MSNYYYKGTSAPFYTRPISQMTILGNNTVLAPGYNDFPIQPTNYSQNRPLPFGFLSNSNSPTNVSDSATAYSTTFYTPTNGFDVTNDGRGAKSIRIISLGGGGGGGGYGGNAKVTGNSGNSANGNGGNGGDGGYGNFTYVNKLTLNSNTFDVTVGLGGVLGSNGGDASVKANGGTHRLLEVAVLQQETEVNPI